MIQVPLQSTPSQTLKIVLDGQNVQIALYQKTQGMFIDINSDGVDIVVAQVCRNGVSLIGREYMQFSGTLMFVDIQGVSDPDYTGLNTRYVLLYATQAEIDALIL